MPNHTGRLVLSPQDPHAAPERDLVRGVLHGAGFIAGGQGDSGLGGDSAGGEWSFAVGPCFLGLLIFAGCAVTLPAGAEGSPRCQVRIPPPSPVPRLIWGRNTRPPRCPGCRARLEDWPRRLPDWEGRAGAGLACPRCGEIRPPWRWDWKQQGGFGRLFVLVDEVFPGEAVPSPKLAELLTRAGGCPWRHFYVQD
jgi:hypothetical protein